MIFHKNTFQKLARTKENFQAFTGEKWKFAGKNPGLLHNMAGKIRQNSVQSFSTTNFLRIRGFEDPEDMVELPLLNMCPGIVLNHQIS